MKHPSGSASCLSRLSTTAACRPGGRSSPSTPSVSPTLTLVLPPQRFPCVGGQTPSLFCFHPSLGVSTAEVFQPAAIQGCEQPSGHSAGSCCTPCGTPAMEKHVPQSSPQSPPAFPNLSLYLYSQLTSRTGLLNRSHNKMQPLKGF